MNMNTANTAAQQPMEKVRLIAALALVIAGVAGYILLTQHMVLVRLLPVAAGLVLAAAVAYSTGPAQRFLQFVRDAIGEWRKMVWPTIQETAQSTLVIMAFITVIALVLWLVDKFSGWLFSTVLLNQ